MLRDFFEISTNSIVRVAAYSLYKQNVIDKKLLDKIYSDMGVDSSKPNPWEV
jgi:pyruvate dehydrogenase E1 component